MGFRSGEFGGHWVGFQKQIFSSFKKASVFFARWAGALSCWKIKAAGLAEDPLEAATRLIQGTRVFLRASMYASAPSLKPSGNHIGGLLSPVLATAASIMAPAGCLLLGRNFPVGPLRSPASFSALSNLIQRSFWGLNAGSTTNVFSSEKKRFYRVARI